MCCSTSHHNQPQHDPKIVNTKWGDDGWCICPGADKEGACCGGATAEDGLCTRCRVHCAPVFEKEYREKIVQMNERVADIFKKLLTETLGLTPDQVEVIHIK